VENQRTFITHLSHSGISRKIVLNILATLSSILTTARNWGYNCEQIDLSKLSLPPRGPRHEARYFTADQLQRILALAEEPWHTLFSVLAMTGLRAVEAFDLQVGDIDFVRKSITSFRPYVNAVDGTFETEIDYAMLVKAYTGDESARERCSPSEIVDGRPVPVMGNPKPQRISKSHVERQNLAMHGRIRRRMKKGCHSPGQGALLPCRSQQTLTNT
jgi:integrase